jgi:hypothetical protein
MVYNKHKEVIVKAPTWSSPPSPWYNNIPELFQAFLDGGVGVLPDSSMIAYCNRNASKLLPESQISYNHLREFEWKSGVTSLA